MLAPLPIPEDLAARMAPPQPQDAGWMQRALELARRGLGRTGLNPSVGCVLVHEQGQSLGEGWTQPGGRPHAETQAIEDAQRRGASIQGCTAYVTLEPCSHHGQTPPCCLALHLAGVARVVVALLDPDPRVGGRGLRYLLDHGVQVTCGVLAQEAWRVHLPFMTRVLLGRPYVIAKVAMSLDGRIATRSGASFPLTGAAARQRVHVLRDRVDAILVGRGTVTQDDPRLTCRLPRELAGQGGPRDPHRLVLDPTLQAPATSQIFGLQRRKRSSAPTTVLVAQGEGSAQRRQALQEEGARLLEVPRGGDGGLDLVYTLERLIPLGISSILVEGGGATLASFHEAKLIDAWVAHIAPALIGGQGAVSPLSGQGAHGLEGVARLSWRGMQRLGEDIELLAAVQSDVYGLD